MINNEMIRKEVSGEFPHATFEEFQGMLTISVKKDEILRLMKYLKEHPEFSFDYLTDLTGVDYLDMEIEPRFAVVYHLYSFKNNYRIRVKALVPEDDVEVDSMSSLWKGAIWLEREAFDMFGFQFRGHPDLRRILMPDNFDGFPLRKDYPVRGRGERDILLDLK